MMRIRSYGELEVYQLAFAAAIEIFQLNKLVTMIRNPSPWLICILSPLLPFLFPLRPHPRIDQIPQPIPQQVEAKHRQHQHRTGKQGQPPFP